MSDTTPIAAKRSSQQQSDLAQVLSHGPAHSQSYGKVLGALLMLFAITKTRRGPVGIAAAATFAMTIFYNIFWK
jgi:hypothetical protein